MRLMLDKSRIGPRKGYCCNDFDYCWTSQELAPERVIVVMNGKNYAGAGSSMPPSGSAQGNVLAKLMEVSKTLQ